MKKILVTGANGKLGSLLVQRPNFFALECDVTKPESIYEGAYRLLGDKWEIAFAPLIVVNCAAISSIDECEKNYDKAIDVNVHGVTNLHSVFGSRVLNISSDHVFSGKNWYLPKEDVKPSPPSAYGYTKLASEQVSRLYGGKTIRLSRAVSLFDYDISEYLRMVSIGQEIEVPSFFHRNYVHREFAVDGIEYLVNNWDSIKFNLVHYASTDQMSMHLFILKLVEALGLDTNLVRQRDKYFNDAPRPKRGGLKVGLAKKLGFPMYTISNTVAKLKEDYA